MVPKYSKLNSNLIKVVLEQFPKDDADIALLDDTIDIIENDEHIYLNESLKTHLMVERYDKYNEGISKDKTQKITENDENLEEFQHNENYKNVESVIPSNLFFHYFKNTDLTRIR